MKCGIEMEITRNKKTVMREMQAALAIDRDYCLPFSLSFHCNGTQVLRLGDLTVLSGSLGWCCGQC